MKTNIKLISIIFFILTSNGSSKTAPLESKIIPPKDDKFDKNIQLTPVNLIKPASFSVDDNIDFRVLFSLLILLNM